MRGCVRGEMRGGTMTDDKGCFIDKLPEFCHETLDQLAL